MKRRCKRIDICDRALVEQAVIDCLRPAKKRRRADTRHLFARLLGEAPSVIREALREKNELYWEGVQRVTDMLIGMLTGRKLELRPVYQQERIDPSSHKKRTISILSIEHLLLDHVAVRGLQELSARIGEYQVSSIKGRGGHYGKKAIERWLRSDESRYACKLDIKDFYGSVNRSLLFAWLERRVANEPLLWLVRQLVTAAPRGMAIGSYLSQTLANIYLSDLYHLAMERCISKRGTRQVRHALFYMDDMLLLGRNKRQLRFAAYRLMERAADMGLRIKPNWHVFRVEDSRPIDMLGFRFSRNRTTLRKRVFRAARRVIVRVGRAIRRGWWIGIHRAARLASYHGYAVSTACKRFLERAGGDTVFSITFNTISNHANKSTLYTGA